MEHKMKTRKLLNELFPEVPRARHIRRPPPGRHQSSRVSECKRTKIPEWYGPLIKGISVLCNVIRLLHELSSNR